MTPPFSPIRFLFGSYTITQRIRFMDKREELRKEMMREVKEMKR